MALHEKESIYFDRIVRTEKLHTLMALAYSYYYFDSKDRIQESLEYFLNVFREPPKGSTEGSGTYIGTDKQFTSQYTPALEFGLLKNSKNKELTDLGIKLVKGDISPNQFISNVMLNYFQYINGKPRNLLLELFKYLNNHKIQEFENTDLYNIYNEDKSNRDNINILFDILKETIFFTYDISNKKMKLKNLFNLETLISECNKDMYSDTFKVQDYLGKSNHQMYAEFITQPTFIVNNLYSINGSTNKIKVKNKSHDLTEEELGVILKESFSRAKNKGASIHLFGIEYGKYILRNKLNVKNILIASELNASYRAEIYKGINLSSVAVSYSGDKPILKNDITKPHNRIIYGAPGTGKSYKLNQEVEEFNNVNRVTFYDGYTHGQFVGTYKPVPSGEGVSYKYVAGPFIKQLIEAIRNPNDNYCLVIEEINRARADKVFGNIFQLLDRDSSDKSQYPIELSEDQLDYFTENLESEYSEELKKIMINGLSIPSNLYIWATMNSADQGVYPLDSAFKRRWNFEHIGLDENEKQFKDGTKKLSILYETIFENGSYYIQKAVEWNDFRKVINNKLLDEGIQEDRLIAPFFINPKQFIQEEGLDYIKNLYELEPNIYIDKVIMYLFEDVLRHKKKSILFKNSYKSFSQLKKDYKEKIYKEEEFSIFNDEIRDELRKFKIQDPEVIEEEAE